MEEENQDCTNELLSSESLRKSPELVRKSPIFNYFKVLESDKRRAECDLCGQNFSLGSEKPKFQSTSTIKNHLRTKHQTEYSKFLQEFNESKDKKPAKVFKTIKKSSNKKPNHDSISYHQNMQGELTSYQQNMEELTENDTETWENPLNFSENSIKIGDNPWQVDSIDSFYYLKCPECGFDTKDEDFFELHATENHPLSFTFYGQTYKEPELDKDDLISNFIKPEPISDAIDIKQELPDDNYEKMDDCDENLASNDQFLPFFEDPLYNSITTGIPVDETKNLASLEIAENQESNGREPEKSLKSMKKKAPIWHFFKRLETDKSKAVCNMCGESYSLGAKLQPKFQSTGNIKNHLRAKHNEEYLKFAKLQADFEEKKGKIKMEKESKTIYYCSICNASFVRKSNLKHHIESTHERKKYNCPICNSSFTKKGILKRHIESIHEGEKPFKCTLCNASFTHNQHLKRHLLSVHEGKKHDCTICAKSFSQSVNLKRHVASVHEGKKTTMCPTCGFGFYDKRDLQRHISSVHLGEKPFKCPNCDKSFALQVKLVIRLSL